MWGVAEENRAFMRMISGFDTLQWKTTGDLTDLFICLPYTSLFLQHFYQVLPLFLRCEIRLICRTRHADSRLSSPTSDIFKLAAHIMHYGGVSIHQIANATSQIFTHSVSSVVVQLLLYVS